MAKKALVSSLSMAFKRSVGSIVDDPDEQKKKHREQLGTLIDRYMEKLDTDEVDGIRNAKDLVEVIKMNLLLMGDVTERTETKNDLDEIKVQKVQQVLDMDDERLQDIINSAMMALNDANDGADR